jgi:ATP phosphoribosyltransferase
MPSFAVRFKGLLFKSHLALLGQAGIELESSEPGMRIGPIQTGEPINTVIVEADSEDEALAKVKERLVPDDVNFSSWESDAI